MENQKHGGMFGIGEPKVEDKYLYVLKEKVGIKKKESLLKA